MTNEHDSATALATSLRVIGEVRHAKAWRSARADTDARRKPVGVVGGSMSGKDDACECRRSPQIDCPKGCCGEVRAAIVARKRGSACGAKGGRKAEAVDDATDSNNRNRLPPRLERRGQKCRSVGIKSSLHRSTKSRCWVMSLDHPTIADLCPMRVKLLTGEPCAGDPHARFGGRGGANQCAIPTPI